MVMDPVPKDPEKYREFRILTVNGDSTESFNDIGHEGVALSEGEWRPLADGMAEAVLAPHSVNVIQIR